MSSDNVVKLIQSGILTEPAVPPAVLRIRPRRAARSRHVRAHRHRKMNGVDPQVWLADVLARIAGHPAHRLDDLLHCELDPRFRTTG